VPAIQFANGPLPVAPNTTLTSSIAASGAASPTVASAAFLPAAGPFLIVVDSERILVDSISGTTLTILAGGRAQEGTTAAAHSSGAAVWQVWSVATLARHIDERAAKGLVPGAFFEATGNDVARAPGVNTDMFVTFTADATRRYKVCLRTQLNFATAAQIYALSLASGGTVGGSDGTVIDRFDRYAAGDTAAGSLTGMTTSFVLWTGSGATTLRLKNDGGSGGNITIVGSAAIKRQMWVEDVGAA
jgi:hypothetical protein